MRKIICVILALFLASSAAFAGYQIFREYTERQESADTYTDLENLISFPEVLPEEEPDETNLSESGETEPAPVGPTIDFAGLEEINEDCVAWIYIEDKALKNGYVIEIQEPSTIVQPGVLVGLNSLLEQTGSITLPTGEIIERHPDAVVVVTTNVSYEGCRGMNQSVIDRMSLVRDVEMPTPEVMVQRAMSVTGATDEYQVSQMVQVVNDLAEYCRKNSITDGSYGMRSLIDWIISAEITGDVYNSALYTIISKATADELDREALISAVLEPIIPPKRKKASA